MMNSKEILQGIRSLTVWKREGKRAPHKPLLLLLALGKFQAGKTNIAFEDCEETLRALLREFGTGQLSTHPEYPFWHLQSSDLWSVACSPPLLDPPSASPTAAKLRTAHATGGFTPEVLRVLRASPSLVDKLAQQLLQDHFPPTLHQDILDATGLGVRTMRFPSSRRDPSFRGKILTAYGHRCALCGLDMSLGGVSIALEAAHIRWHQAGGPDVPSNGLSLCALHHKLFDLGAFTIHTDYRALVSEQVSGASECERVMLHHHGRKVAQPVRAEDRPSLEHLGWHRVEVFKERPRPLSQSA